MPVNSALVYLFCKSDVTSEPVSQRTLSTSNISSKEGYRYRIYILTTAKKHSSGCNKSASSWGYKNELPLSLRACPRIAILDSLIDSYEWSQP